MQTIVLYAGSAVLILWGIAHIAIPTRGIVKSFGAISIDNKRILLMEWIMEGLLLIFIGTLVVAVTWFAGFEHSASAVVYRSASVMLAVMASLSAFTGARTSILPMKLCPPIFAAVALGYWLASL